jgi:hypothetical protein
LSLFYYFIVILLWYFIVVILLSLFYYRYFIIVILLSLFYYRYFIIVILLCYFIVLFYYVICCYFCCDIVVVFAYIHVYLRKCCLLLQDLSVGHKTPSFRLFRQHGQCDSSSSILVDLRWWLQFEMMLILLRKKVHKSLHATLSHLSPM